MATRKPTPDMGELLAWTPPKTSTLATMLQIADIRRDGGTQPRGGTELERVEEYARLIGDGVDLGAVDVMFDGTNYWLYDGFHRTEAHELVGLPDIACTIHQGTQEDAQWASYAANKAHGLNRSNADKERAVRAALRHPKGASKSDREIAKHVGVTHPTVAKYRAELESSGKIYQIEERTVTRGDSVYKQDTGKIGDNGRRPAAKPSPEQRQYSAAVAAADLDDKLLVDYTDEDWKRLAERRASESAAAPVATPSPMSVHYSSETPEHYTPVEIIEAVIKCMGGIDLDPCSNSHETPNVPAADHYTRADNGLAQPWHGCVYMNPPYGREIDEWISKLVSEYRNGAVAEAIALVPCRTDTQWWQRLRDYHVCFVTGRLTFIGNDDPAPFPSAVFYLGTSVDAFMDAFEGLGDIWYRKQR